MGSKTWINWVAFGVCTGLAWALVFSGISAVQSTAWFAASRDHAAITVLSTILAMAIVNVGMLVGYCLCRLAGEGRSKAPRTRPEPVANGPFGAARS